MALPARLKTPLKLAASFLIAFVALELVTRGWLRVRGRAYSGWETERAIGEMAEAMGAAVEGARPRGPGYALHPFTGWEEHNTGRRITEDVARTVAGEYDQSFEVLLLGSSVAAGFANDGAEVFVELLQAAPLFEGREVKLMAYGRSAYKQPQQLMMLVWLLTQGLEPDAVVCIDGFNELALSLANAQRGVPTSYPGWGQWGPLISRVPFEGATLTTVHELEQARRAGARVQARVERYGLANSALLGSLMRARMVSAQERWQTAAEELSDALARLSKGRLGTLPLLRGEELVLPASAELWKNSTRAMMDLCRAREIPFLHVLQPNGNVPGSKVLTEEERLVVRASENWIQAAEEGYPLMRAACEQLRAEGLDSLDASMIFRDVEERVWRNAGHLNRVGNLCLGQVIGASMLELLGRR